MFPADRREKVVSTPSFVITCVACRNFKASCFTCIRKADTLPALFPVLSLVLFLVLFPPSSPPVAHNAGSIRRIAARHSLRRSIRHICRHSWGIPSGKSRPHFPGRKFPVRHYRIRRYFVRQRSVRCSRSGCSFLHNGHINIIPHNIVYLGIDNLPFPRFLSQPPPSAASVLLFLPEEKAACRRQKPDAGGRRQDLFRLFLIAAFFLSICFLPLFMVQSHHRNQIEA